MKQNKPVHTIYYYDKEETKQWYEYWKLNNKLHREDGPAYIAYYENGSIECESYRINNKLHREDGPAWIEYYGYGSVYSKIHYLNNIPLKREEWISIISPTNKVKNLLTNHEIN